MLPQRKRYPTDVTNTQWLFIQELLADLKPVSRKGRKRSVELRSIVNAINYRWKTGCTWRLLPHDFPKWETVYTYFNNWRRLGLLPKLREILIMKKYPLGEETVLHSNPSQVKVEDEFGHFENGEPLVQEQNASDLPWPDTNDHPQRREHSMTGNSIQRDPQEQKLHPDKILPVTRKCELDPASDASWV